ncbi:MAG TPA: APC family permease, partial [Gemmatimonadaceae bacterium]|nr:APC family permease [Gemmatimonadaceae bacterium]
WGLAASIVNVTVGGGIFRLPSSPDVAGRLGAAAPLAYLVCAGVMALIVVCFAEAGSRVSLTGGPYAYVEVAFGPFAGFMTGVLLWLGGTAAVAAVSTVFVRSVVDLLPRSADLAWLSGPAARWAELGLTFAIVTAANVVGVRQGARLSAASTVAKLVPLVMLATAGLGAVNGANLRWETAPAAGDVTRASAFLIFAFAGIESALVPSGEVRDPARTVPRGIFLAMTCVTVLYVLLQVVAQGVLGPALVASETPLADAAGRVFGPWGARLLSLGVVLSTFGYLSGMTLAMPRALFAFARDGILPRSLAAVHPRFRTPHVAIVVQSVIALLLAVGNAFEKLMIIASVSVLLVYLAGALAAWQLRRRGVQTAGGTPFRIPGAAIVPWVAAAVILGLLSSITLKEWSVLAGILAAAAALFLLRSRTPAPVNESL